MTCYTAKISTANYEFSDSFLVPKDIANIGDILSFTNSQGKSVIGSVHGFHEEPGIVYMPLWMIYTIPLATGLQLNHIYKVPCTKIYIKPFHKDFTKLPEWVKELEQSLNHYKTLTCKTAIPVNVGGYQQIYIDRICPDGHKTFFISNNGDIDIEIVRSFEEEGALPIERKPTQSSSFPHFVMLPRHLRKDPISDSGQLFSGTMYGFMGNTNMDRTPTENAYIAAKKRLGML